MATLNVISILVFESCFLINVMVFFCLLLYIRMMSTSILNRCVYFHSVNDICIGVQLEQRTFSSKHNQIIYSYFCFSPCVSVIRGSCAIWFQGAFFITFGKDANNYRNYRKDPITFFHHLCVNFFGFAIGIATVRKTCLFYFFFKYQRLNMT